MITNYLTKIIVDIMLVLSIAWLILLGFTYIIGIAILHQVKGNHLGALGDRCIVAIWLGVVIISVSLLTLSLFIPLSFAASWLTILLISLITSVSQRSKILSELKQIKANLSLYNITLFLAILIGVAAFVSRRIIWYDTGLYHFQLIRWFSQFGIVQGLTLIHSRFGFISSWFSLATTFNWGVLESHLVAFTGGLAFLITILHFWIINNRILRRSSNFEDWFAYISLFFSISFSIWMGMPISPTPDLPVILLTLMIAWLFLKIQQITNSHSQSYFLDIRLIPIILSAGAVTFKLSAMPLVVFSIIFYLFNKSQKLQFFIFGSFLSFVIFAPLLIANIITSGCPLYPSSIACLNLPWSLDPFKVKETAYFIGTWAKWTGFSPENANSWNWIGTWLTSDKLYFLNRQTALLIALSLIAALGSKIFAKNTKTAQDIIRQNKIVFWLGLMGIIYFMSTAPSLRFGLGYLLIFPSFFLALTSYKRSNLSLMIMVAMIGLLFSLRGSYGYYDIHSFSFYLMTISLLLISLILVFKIKSHLKTCLLLVNLSLIGLAIATYLVSNQNYLVYSVSDSNSLAGHQTDIFLFLPPPLMSDIEIMNQKSGQVTYYNPQKSDQCWAAQLMCTPEKPSDIEFRIPSMGIKKGFIKVPVNHN